jgi:hypothetical protein
MTRTLRTLIVVIVLLFVVAAVGGLLAAFGGTEETSTSAQPSRDAPLSVSVSIDAAARRVRIDLEPAGDEKYLVLFLTRPDGSRDLLAESNSRTEWVGTNLPGGRYTYTAYWIPLQGRDADSVSVDEVVSHGTTVSGQFSMESQ